MTNDEFKRFQKIMEEKYLPQLSRWPTREDAVRSIIQGVIADTSLLVEGSVPLDSWETAVNG